MLKRLLMIGAVAASISAGGCVGVGAASADPAVCGGPCDAAVCAAAQSRAAVRAGRVADLDAVQLAGCAGSGRYTGQRRLMTGKMHDVFIVISEGADGEHVARTVYAADEDDARQTHQDNYADEPLVAVHQ